jgi:phage/plasmid-like protein (TIGR03299 family)
MAHEVQTMAFVRETPWHGLGNQLPPGQSIETWQEAAGMNWDIVETPVMYAVPSPGGFTFRTNPDRKVLFRSDNHAPLSVVSTDRYQVVQPRQVIEFYRDLVAAGGFELETAGVLKGGKKLWALAKTNQSTSLKGGDQVKAYLLLATSCDGTLATSAFFTSVRVVCNNTLQLAVNGSEGVIKVPHSTTFDPALVKQQLGLGLSSWEAFTRSIKKLASRPVSEVEAKNYLVKVLGDPEFTFEEQLTKPLKATQELFSGAGMGAGMSSAKGTAWGLLNALTQYVDHDRQARSQDNRLDSAWFGTGAAIKAKAFEEAMALVA